MASGRRRRRRRAIAIRALCAALAGLAATAAGAQVAPVELYNQGVAAFEAGLYDVAARNFRDLVRGAPGARESVQASFLEPLSIFYGAANGPADAAAAGYRRAADRFAAHQRRFPDSPYGDQIWYWIGTARLAGGEPDAALTALQRHVDQPPEPAPPYLAAARETRARALEQLGRGDEARAAYDALLAAAGADTEGDAPARWLERAGMLLLAEGRYAAAEERFRRILSDYPDSPAAAEMLFFIAEAKYFQGNLAAAAADYRRYLELFPGAAHRPGALFRLARWLLDRGDLAEAREVAAALDDAAGAGGADAGSAAAGTAPVAGAVGLLHGDLAAAAGDWAAAAAAYDRGLAVAGERDLRQVLNVNLALAQVESGTPLQAIASFEEAARGPDAALTEAALFNRAVLLAGERRIDDAAAALQAFLEQFPDSEHRAAVEALLMDMLERAGDQHALLHLFRQIAERRRLTAEEEQRRGIALLESGDEITALETLARTAAELPPAARAESQYRIGAVYARRGEFARSAPFFRAALDEAGDDRELRRRAGYALAVGHFNNGEYEPALRLLEQVTANARGSWLAAAHFAQAAALYRLQRPADAATHFGLAAVAYESRAAQGELIAGAAEGSAALARTWQALALFRDGDLEAARSLFRQLAGDRDSGPHWYRAGLASALLEDRGTAEEEFLTALEAVPPGDSLRPAIQFELARLHLASGDLRAAEAWLERLAAAQPGHRLAAIGRLQLADALRMRGELRAALAAYEAAIAAAGAGDTEAGPPVAELARFSVLQVLAELQDMPALAEEAWNYLNHHPAGARVEQVSERFRAVVAAAGADMAHGYYRRITGAQGSEEATPAAADAARLAYGEALIAGDPGAAEPILLEVVEEGSDDARIAAYFLLGRTYEAAEDWPRASSLYRGLALAEDVEVASVGALGVARSLAASGDSAAAAQEYGAAAIRFAENEQVAGEAWLRGAEAWRAAGDEAAAARFATQLQERFPRQHLGRAGRRAVPSRTRIQLTAPVRLGGGARRRAQDGDAEGSASALTYESERPSAPEQRRNSWRGAVQRHVRSGLQQRCQRGEQAVARRGRQVVAGMEQRQSMAARRPVQRHLVAERDRVRRNAVTAQVGACGQELQRIAARQGEARQEPAVCGRRRGSGARQPHRQVSLARIPNQDRVRNKRGGGEAALDGGRGQLGQVARAVEVGKSVAGLQLVRGSCQGHFRAVAQVGGRQRGRLGRVGGRRAARGAGAWAGVKHRVPVAVADVDQLGHLCELPAGLFGQVAHHYHRDAPAGAGDAHGGRDHVGKHRCARLGGQVGRYQLERSGFAGAVQVGDVHAAVGAAGEAVAGGVVGGDRERQGVPVARGQRGAVVLGQGQAEHAGAAAQVQDRPQAAAFGGVGGELLRHAGEQQARAGVDVEAAEQRLRECELEGVPGERERDRLVQVVAQPGRAVLRRVVGATRRARHTPRFRCSPRCGRHP